MKKKYVIVKTGEEVKLGDFIKMVSKESNSLGTVELKSTILVTEDNIDSFIEEGIIKEIDEKGIIKEIDTVNKLLSIDTRYDYLNIDFYINCLAVRMGYTFDEVTNWLNKLNKVCPRAVLDILLNEISLYLKTRNIEAFNEASEYYSLRLKDGNVGKIITDSSYIAKFKSLDDAKLAKEILKEQLALMYGKQ